MANSKVNAMSLDSSLLLLYPLQNLFEWLSLFERWCVGRVADRNNCNRIDRFAINTQNFVHDCGAEVAHPTRAEPNLCGGQADVLCCDCCINICVVVAILLAGPRLRVVATYYDIERCLLKPLLRISCVEGSALLLTLYDDKLPRLKVYCRWCKPRTFKYIVNLLLLHLAVAVRASRVTSLY